MPLPSRKAPRDPESHDVSRAYFEECAPREALPRNRSADRVGSFVTRGSRLSRPAVAPDGRPPILPPVPDVVPATPFFDVIYPELESTATPTSDALESGGSYSGALEPMSAAPESLEIDTCIDMTDLSLAVEEHLGNSHADAIPSTWASKRQSLSIAMPRSALTPRNPDSGPVENGAAVKDQVLYLDIPEDGLLQFQQFAKDIAAQARLESAMKNPYIQALTQYRKELCEGAAEVSCGQVDSVEVRLATQRSGGLAMLSRQPPPLQEQPRCRSRSCTSTRVDRHAAPLPPTPGPQSPPAATGCSGTLGTLGCVCNTRSTPTRATVGGGWTGFRPRAEVIEAGRQDSVSSTSSKSQPQWPGLIPRISAVQESGLKLLVGGRRMELCEGYQDEFLEKLVVGSAR
mmetsp:Transcript_60544/g.131200  ORF Transcript_60544/g.131200 Transcript_60544/m.131200 type:complete len:402 (-) Transcript_60544:77-1282(-)